MARSKQTAPIVNSKKKTKSKSSKNKSNELSETADNQVTKTNVSNEERIKIEENKDIIESNK